MRHGPPQENIVWLIAIPITYCNTDNVHTNELFTQFVHTYGHKNNELDSGLEILDIQYLNGICVVLKNSYDIYISHTGKCSQRLCEATTKTLGAIKDYDSSTKLVEHSGAVGRPGADRAAFKGGQDRLCCTTRAYNAAHVRTDQTTQRVMADRRTTKLLVGSRGGSLTASTRLLHRYLERSKPPPEERPILTFCISNTYRQGLSHKSWPELFVRRDGVQGSSRRRENQLVCLFGRGFHFFVHWYFLWHIHWPCLLLLCSHMFYF